MQIKFEQNYAKLFWEIRQKAPRWLVIQGYDTCEQFCQDLMFKRSVVTRIPFGLMVVNECIPGVRATLHPCFLEKPNFQDLTEFQVIISKLLSDYDIHRLEIKVFETAGKTIRKVLSRLGFSKEAVLCNYGRDLCSLDRPLISCEIWSIVK